MRYDTLEKAVERNILKLFKVFHKNPAFFLCETDVECYLYSLLINDSVFRHHYPQFKHRWLKQSSKTLLVHTEIGVGIRRKTKKYDISIWKPTKTVEFYEWETIIGIEIKFNTPHPAGKERSSILEDVKKTKENRKGYILWLNWDSPISDSHLEETRKLIKKYGNVKLLYLDVFSDPIKTNVKELLN
jgi:hypothetical protein